MRLHRLALFLLLWITQPAHAGPVEDAIRKGGGEPLVLVTHQLIVTAVTGVFPESGEVVVVAPAAEGKNAGVRFIGTIKPFAIK